MKVIIKCVNIKLGDTLGCFHYILNAPRSGEEKYLIMSLKILYLKNPQTVKLKIEAGLDIHNLNCAR